MKRDAARHETGLQQDPLTDRVAFGVIAVEHSVIRTGERHVDLPRQIRCVLNAGVHALPAHGGVDMRRVPGEEHATVPVLRDLPLVAMESGLPPHLAHSEVGVHCPRKDADDLVGVHGFGVGYLVVAVPHHRAVPRPVGVMASVGGQECEHVPGTPKRQAAASRPVRQLDVGEHDRRQDRFAAEIRTDQLANRTVRSVGAD
jgi:hypothetical protein